MVSEVVFDGRVVEVRRLRDPSEYRRVMDAQVEVWGMSDYSSAVTHHLLIAADRRGGLVLGAFEKDSGRVVGLVFGFLARSPDGKLYHYSHMTGVVPEYRYRGLGYVLKLKQREYVLNQGLDLIAWTYDPLQAPNARFNVGKLGVVVRKFYVNYYGELSDSINVGMPTDRFEAEWWIKSRLVELKLQGKLKAPTLDDVLELGARVVTKTEEVNDVRILTSYSLGEEAPLILIEIPDDLSKLRRSTDALLRWRLGLREVFNHYLNEGNYVVVEFISSVEGGVRRNFYILWRSDLERILSGELPWSYVR